ncbi:MAG: hypothetical protein NVS1B7_4390 [Candidatus Saccharimonadales bacterium]
MNLLRNFSHKKTTAFILSVTILSLLIVVFVWIGAYVVVSLPGNRTKPPTATNPQSSAVLSAQNSQLLTPLPIVDPLPDTAQTSTTHKIKTEYGSSQNTGHDNGQNVASTSKNESATDHASPPMMTRLLHTIGL